MQDKNKPYKLILKENCMKQIIKIMGEITDYTFRSTFETVKEILDKSRWSDDIYVFIHSAGGEVEATLAIIDLLESLPNKVFTVNMGRAESCAATLFIHGKRRYMAKHAKFNFHSPATYFKENYAIPTLEFDAKAKALNIISEQIGNFLKEKTNIPHELINNGLSTSQGITLFADECIKYSVADEIITNITEVLY